MMPEKTLLQLCNEISLVKENIKERYPELHRHLQINLSISSDNQVKNNSDKREEFKKYLITLKQVLQQQLNPKQPVAPLPDLTDSLAYNPERIEKIILNQVNGQKTILFAFAKNQELKTHTAPHEVILVVLEGICAFTLDQEEPFMLHSGQVIKIPGKVKHSLQALSDFKMLLHI